MDRQEEKTQIITNPSGRELKEHGSYRFPFLVSRERLSRYETGSFLWHWHTEIEFTLVTDGCMIYQINDSRTERMKETAATFPLPFLPGCSMAMKAACSRKSMWNL